MPTPYDEYELELIVPTTGKEYLDANSDTEDVYALCISELRDLEVGDTVVAGHQSFIRRLK